MASFQYTWVKVVDEYRGVPDDETMEYIRTLGDDGWEMVSVCDGVAYFKRACWDYCSVEESVSRIDSVAFNNQNLLEEIKGLLQMVVDNASALSVKPLNAVIQESTKDAKTDATETEDAAVAETLLCRFADEHVALAMDGYAEADKSLELFSIMAGLGGLLPTATAKEHHRHIVKAVYRYYQERVDDGIKICFEKALKRMAYCLSDAESLAVLSEAVEKDVSFVFGANTFFDVVNAVLAFEKEGIAPFVVDNLVEYVELFISALKSQHAAWKDANMERVVIEQVAQLQQAYGIVCQME